MYSLLLSFCNNYTVISSENKNTLFTSLKTQPLYNKFYNEFNCGDLLCRIEVKSESCSIDRGDVWFMKATFFTIQLYRV